MAIHHQYTRPEWLCDTCGEPWPCATGRVRLAAQSDHYLTLMMYLADLWGLACEDLPETSPGLLYCRIIFWARGVPVGVRTG